MAKRKRLVAGASCCRYQKQALTAVRDCIRAPHRTGRGRVGGTCAGFAEVARDLTEAREEGRLIQRLPLERDRDGPPGARPHRLRRATRWRRCVASLRAARPAGAHRGRGAGGRLWPDLGLCAGHGAARDRGDGCAGAGAASRDLGGGLSRHGRGKRDPRRHLLLRTRAARGGGGEARASIPTLRRRSRRCSASASPAKRSKIGSFVRVHEALGDALRYPCCDPGTAGAGAGRGAGPRRGLRRRAARRPCRRGRRYGGGRARSVADRLGPVVRARPATRWPRQAQARAARSGPCRRGDRHRRAPGMGPADRRRHHRGPVPGPRALAGRQADGPRRGQLRKADTWTQCFRMRKHCPPMALREGF
jgi:hypothetical protein